MKDLTLIAIFVIAFVIGPFLTIWALNTLFGLAIDTNFFTWLSAFWLQGVLTAKVSK